MSQRLTVSDVEWHVLRLKDAHKSTWSDKPTWYWYLGLLEEVGELFLSLLRLHKDSPEHELKQIATIAMNWLEKRWPKRKAIYAAGEIDPLERIEFWISRGERLGAEEEDWLVAEVKRLRRERAHERALMVEYFGLETIEGLIKDMEK
jgi:hypothetical protein